MEKVVGTRSDHKFSPAWMCAVDDIGHELVVCVVCDKVTFSAHGKDTRIAFGPVRGKVDLPKLSPEVE